MIKELKRKIEKIQKKPENEKNKIIFVLAACGMIFVFFVWFFSFVATKRANNVSNKSGALNFANLEKAINNEEKINDQNEKIIESLAFNKRKKEIEEIAADYAIKERLLKMEDFDYLQLEKTEKWSDNWYISYKQYYKNLPVEKSNVNFVVSDSEGKVISFGSAFFRDIAVDVGSYITKEEAVGKLYGKIGKEKIEVKNSELVIYAGSDKIKYRLCWKFSVFLTEGNFEYTYFVDAKSGNVL